MRLGVRKAWPTASASALVRWLEEPAKGDRINNPINHSSDSDWV
ncbi:hypothetical protein [Moorena sp. SIO1G6]|nr:hypothetical protein [Moorena sp. SIO1G6]